METLRCHNIHGVWIGIGLLGAFALACGGSAKKAGDDAGANAIDAGADSDSGTDSDSGFGGGLCKEGDLRKGETPCGLNERGAYEQLCAEAGWRDGENCLDPDACRDNATQDAGVCGFNNRGNATDTCITGQWDRSCDDPDECLDNATQPGAAKCGLNDRGVYEDSCDLGSWQETTVCLDPDECLDDATQDGGPCGFNDRGIATDTCDIGQWDRSCDDPDECLDDDTRDGTIPCGAGTPARGFKIQVCEVGFWGADTDTCHDWDLDIGGPCSCTDPSCADTDGEQIWWGVPIIGCTGMEDTLPNATKSCPRSQQAGNNTAHWPNGYCTWMAVKCEGWVCGAGEIPTTGNYDAMTRCPKGRVMLNEVTGNGSDITLSRKYCLQSCDADADCRLTESDPVWDAGAPLYKCRELPDSGVGFCADTNQSFGGISVTATQF